MSGEQPTPTFPSPVRDPTVPPINDPDPGRVSDLPPADLPDPAEP